MGRPSRSVVVAGRILSPLLARLSVLVIVVFGLALVLNARAAPVFPVLDSRVVDQADVLPTQVEADLATRLQMLEANTSRQLVVVTISSLQGDEIENYAYQLGRAWGIGEARKDTGVLFLVAPNERRVWIEAGYGLKPVLTDALSKAILQDIVLTRFLDGKIADGVVAGADALIEQLSLPRDQAMARATQTASGEAKADPFSLFFIGLVALWIVVGLIGTFNGRQSDIWFWPLHFMMRGERGGKDALHGRSGSFGGGGASGRW